MDRLVGSRGLVGTFDLFLLFNSDFSFALFVHVRVNILDLDVSLDSLSPSVGFEYLLFSYLAELTLLLPALQPLILSLYVLEVEVSLFEPTPDYCEIYIGPGELPD